MTHAFGNISAGSDTTAIALRSILYHVLKDRRVYNKIYDELCVLEAPVQFTDANKLHDLVKLYGITRRAISI